MVSNFEIWDRERGILVSIDTERDKVQISLLTINQDEDIKKEQHPIESYLIESGASEERLDIFEAEDNFVQFFAKYDKLELIEFFEAIVNVLKRDIRYIE